jgi:hypothetical protein
VAIVQHTAMPPFYLVDLRFFTVDGGIGGKQLNFWL